MDNPNVKLTQLLQRAFRGGTTELYTALPGHVLSFDPSTQLAQVQIGILSRDGDGTTYEPAPIAEVPVQTYGHSFVVEVAIGPGCEGLILFSKKCLDGWITTGGVAQNPVESRAFSVTDAFFIPGLRSMPGAVSAHRNDGIRLRNAAGSQYVWLKESGDIEATNGAGTIKIAASGDITITGGMVNINGATVDTGGRITAAETTSGGIAFTTHTHGGVQGGPSRTSTPG